MAPGLEEPLPGGRGRAALAACSLLTLVFGSVHAFSVLLPGLEASLGRDRAAVSLTYSLALAALTLAVLGGHRVFARWRPARFIGAVTGLAVAGLLVAAAAPGLGGWWLGYGVVFGAANGFAYGYALQLAAQANPDRPGLAMGLVTAVYALGASLAAPALAAAAAAGGPGGAAMALAIAVALAGLAAMAILSRSGLRFEGEPAAGEGSSAAGGARVALWAFGYGFGVAAGLMTAGQATGMALAAGLDEPLAVGVAAAFAVANMVGGLGAGWAADRLALTRLMAALPLVSALAALLMMAATTVAMVFVAIAALGLAYGALIALYPAAIGRHFGLLAGPRVYGRVFIAWGLAGLVAPWLSAALYDATGGYTVALGLAAAVSLASSLTALRLARPRAQSSC